jgi:DNA-binding NtrC family response regulator
MSILIIDDEEILQDVLTSLLTKEGYSTLSAGTGREALDLLAKEEVELVLLDLMLPDTSGLEVLKRIRASDPDQVVVVITAFSSIEGAIEAMREGAFHYIPKPFKNEEVLHLVRRAAERRRLQVENLLLRSRLDGMGEIVGRSRPMHEVFELMRRAAPARSNILIVGESGTGKELVARAIHRLSPRREQPFVPVHTSAIPSELLESTLFGHVKGAFTGAVQSRKGLFEAAHEGTLFLDEVGTISLETQTKLLRVIQEREIRRVGGLESKTVDVRLVAATNTDLWHEVEVGRFREDLYYRLNVITIELPPLRERKEDVPLLAAHFLKLYADENQREVGGFSPPAMDAMTEYSWPGNVRELENAVERAVVLCRGQTVEVDELPQPLRSSSAIGFPTDEIPADGVDFRQAIASYQTHLIRQALARSDNVQRRAAKLLNLSPTTLNEMVHRLGLRPDSDGGAGE